MFDYFDLQRLEKVLELLQGRAVLPAESFGLAQPQVLYSEGEPDFAQPQRLRVFAAHEHWGGDDANAWFRTVLKIPQILADKPLWMEVYTGREDTKDIINPQLLAYVDGRETQGLDRNHPAFLVTKGAAEGESITVDFDAWFGLANEGASWTDAEREPSCFQLRAFVRDETVEALYWDMKVPCDTAVLLEKDDPDRLCIQRYMTQAANLLDLRDTTSEAFVQSVEAARTYLKMEFYGKACRKDGPKAYIIGHTHIDVAWLWAFRHTRRKAARSFSTMLALMEQYPDFQFMSSQPQLYAYMQEDHPALYARIGEAAKAGQWHPDGAMWLEADCNLTSGESLVRQFVYGKRFFRAEFGVDSKVLWLPDVFGYSASLPQICKQCGVDYFMTTKINWNDTNQMPNDSFYWYGLDGSRVLTHFIPTRGYNEGPVRWAAGTTFFTTYNGELAPNQVMGGWKRYNNKDISNSFLISYGHGDGGGGVTREMVEQHRRMQCGIPGCPVTEHISPRAFFETMEREVQDNPRTPAWHGELYFEYHRGTYTSVARTKRNNRKAEYALTGAEFAAVLAARCGVAALSAVNTQAELQNLWRLALTNQFHDILPGSSITQVYDDTDKIYAHIFARTREITAAALQAVASRVGQEGGKGSIVVFNPLGFVRGGVVTLPESCTAAYLRDDAGHVLPVQQACAPYACGAAQTIVCLCCVPQAPGMGYTTLTPCDAPAPSTPETLRESRAADDSIVYDNGVLALRFAENGQLASVYDKEANRELLPDGKMGNVLTCYEDRPHNFDAWDLDISHKEHRWEISAESAPVLVENGPVRAVLRTQYRWMESTIWQDVIVYADSRRIEFSTAVDWQQDHIFLKAAFPVDIFAEKATFDVQFGAVERPTHKNTSWDFAKFETCAHKWADVSEGEGYGVSLFSESKYGFDVHDGVMHISLLKSATYPARDVDKGMHTFAYALYPHLGGWRTADTATEAYGFNVPLMAVAADGASHALTDTLPHTFSAVQCDTPGVMTEVLKPAEDGKGIVVRAYELFGQRTEATFATALDGAVCAVNLLEEAPVPIASKDGSFTARFNPCEIKTFLIR